MFKNLGFEKYEILGRTAFKIPIYEAIYMLQTIGLGTERYYYGTPKEPFVEVFMNDGTLIEMPNLCPHVSVDHPKKDELSKGMLNPLLAPSMNYMKKIYPDFFINTQKYLMFYDRKLIEDIKKTEMNLADFIIFHDGQYFGEGIMEYITGSLFRKKGYIVDRFSCSLIIGWGGPDLFAIKYPELQNKLMKIGIIEGGFYLNELELLDMLGERKSSAEINNTSVAVIEVESRTQSNRFSKGYHQLLKYLDCDCFTEGYVSIPFEEKRARTTKGSPSELGFVPYLDVGIVTVSEEGEIIVRECTKSYGREDYVNHILKIVERVVKLSLLKNLSLQKIFEILPKVYSFYDDYLAIDYLDIECIANLVRNSQLRFTNKCASERDCI